MLLQEEVEHGLLCGFHHRDAIGCPAAAVAGRLDQRRDPVAGDDIPHEHRGLQQARPYGKWIRAAHAQWRGVAHDVETGRIRRTGMDAAAANPGEQVQQVAGPRAVRIKERELAYASLQQRDRDGAARRARAQQQGAGSLVNGAAVAVRPDEGMAVEHVAMPCHAPSPVRRMTLTQPRRLATGEAVAQCAKAAALWGMVTSRPSTLRVHVNATMTASRLPAGTSIGMQTALAPRDANPSVSRRGDLV